ncbi:MAG: phytoene desaturase [Rhodospirillales bacterium]|nr:phytoene desaturase [Rhodospirillales bacterium]
MRTQRVVVIGAGIGGLVAALELASLGLAVTVVERAATPGGKLRQVNVDGQQLDAGPTVFTMRWVFDEILAGVNASLADYLDLQPVDVLARHAWSVRERLDLFADTARAADAIGALAGPAEAKRYRSFCAQARRIYQTLERPFICAARPGLPGLVRNVGIRNLDDLWHIQPFATMWQALSAHFHDPRLRQLFGRYATYCGSSPYAAPATLMLIAHVEQQGVWLVRGGMYRIAQVLTELAAARGAQFRYAEEASGVLVAHGRAAGVLLATGERLDADAVVVNADTAAIASGRLGSAIASAVRPTPRARRSLSAITWALVARTHGFPLVRHCVFFSQNYAAEFDDLFKHRRLPRQPTVYVCAQDRTDTEAATGGPERMLCLVNAPAGGDAPATDRAEIERCERSAFELLERCGLHVQRRPEATVITTPRDFERLFPATGGALYGPATHGWRATFRRPGPRCHIPGLYLAGGSTHPGPGVPMAALSGRQAAASLLADLASTSRSAMVAMPGGTSTR